MSTPELRIADADRDAAVSALGEHFAAGRLTHEEFDERSEQAMAARMPSELTPLFADLPAPWPPVTGRRASASTSSAPTSSTHARDSRSGAWSRRGRGLAVLPIPLIVLAVVAAVVVFRAPWLLFVAFGLLWCSGGVRRTWHGR